MTGWFRVCFVFSSFGPLYFIVWIKLWLTTGVCSVSTLVFLGLGLLGLGIARFLSGRLKTDEGHPFRVADVRPADSEIFPYLMTYIPILLENDLSNAAFAYPVAVLYLLVFILYFKLDSPYLNPFFALFGLRIYEARMATDGSLVVIVSKGRRLSGTEELYLHEIGTGDLYYCETIPNDTQSPPDQGS